MKTPRQRAESLLAVHGGSCFCPKFHELVKPFEEMRREGRITMNEYNGATTGYLIRKKGWTPKQMPASLR